MALAARRYIEVEVNASKALRALGAIEKSSGAAERRLAGLQDSARRVGNVFRGFVAFLGIREFVALSDAATDLSSRLRGVTGSVEEAAAAQAELLEIANRNGVEITALGRSYGQLGSSIDNITHQELTETLDIIATGLSTTGATTQQANAVLLQFGQGMASARLQGDEFRSVYENLPQLLKAWQKAAGLTGQSLRDLSSSGAFTTRSFLDNRDAIRANLIEMTGLERPPLTVARAFNVLRNNVVQLFSDLGGGGTSPLQALAAVILDIANALPQLSGSFSAVLTIFGELIGVGRSVASVFGEIGSSLFGAFQGVVETVSQSSGEVQDFGGLMAFVFQVELPLAIFAFGEAFKSTFVALGGFGQRVADTFFHTWESAIQGVQLLFAKVKLSGEEFLNLFGAGLDTASTVGQIDAIRANLGLLSKDFNQAQRDITASTGSLFTNAAAAIENKRATLEAALAERELGGAAEKTAIELNNSSVAAAAAATAGKNTANSFKSLAKQIRQIGEVSGAAALDQGGLLPGLDKFDVQQSIREIGVEVRAGDLDAAETGIRNTKDAIVELLKTADGFDTLVLRDYRDQLADLAQGIGEGTAFKPKVDTSEAETEIFSFIDGIQSYADERPIKIKYEIVDPLEITAAEEGIRRAQ